MKEYHGSAMLNLTSGNINFEEPLVKDKTSFNDRSQGYVNLYFGQDFLKGGSTDYKTSDNNLYYESKDIGKLCWGNTIASAGWSLCDES